MKRMCVIVVEHESDEYDVDRIAQIVQSALVAFDTMRLAQLGLTRVRPLSSHMEA